MSSMANDQRWSQCLAQTPDCFCRKERTAAIRVLGWLGYVGVMGSVPCQDKPLVLASWSSTPILTTTRPKRRRVSDLGSCGRLWPCWTCGKALIAAQYVGLEVCCWCFLAHDLVGASVTVPYMNIMSMEHQLMQFILEVQTSSRWPVQTKLAKQSLAGSGPDLAGWSNRFEVSHGPRSVPRSVEVPVLETSKGCIFSSGAIARWAPESFGIFRNPGTHQAARDGPDGPTIGPGISHESVDRLGSMVKTSLRLRIRFELLCQSF